MWSKGVLNYDSGICCFKEVKNTAKTLIIVAFKTRNESKYESTNKYNFGLIIQASLEGLLPLTLEGPVQGFVGKNRQKNSAECGVSPACPFS